MLTELQSNILGVNPNCYSVFDPDEMLPLPPYEDTLSNLLIGSPDPLGMVIPKNYLEELDKLQIRIIHNRFSSGLLPLCQSQNISFQTLLNQIDSKAFALETNKNWLDLKAEYWQTKWLAYRNPQSIVAAHIRTKKILIEIGKLFIPTWLKNPKYENYLQQNVLAYLGSYIIVFLGEPIEEQLDDWSQAIETNWLETLEARNRVYEQFKNKLEIATVSQCWSLIEELDSLRPINENLEPNYEYCVAKISDTDYSRLKNILFNRITGKENDNEFFSLGLQSSDSLSSPRP